MNETSLRWKARIGALKPFAALALILAGLGLIFAIGQFAIAVRSPAEPEMVTVRQLVDGTIGSGRYVRVSGYAVYDWGYEETENGRVVATYYALLDDKGGYLLVVKTVDLHPPHH